MSEELFFHEPKPLTKGMIEKAQKEGRFKFYWKIGIKDTLTFAEKTIANQNRYPHFTDDADDINLSLECAELVSFMTEQSETFSIEKLLKHVEKRKATQAKQRKMKGQSSLEAP